MPERMAQDGSFSVSCLLGRWACKKTHIPRENLGYGRCARKKYGKRARAYVCMRGCARVLTHFALHARKYPRYGHNNDRDVTPDKCCARRTHTRARAFFCLDRDVYGDRWDSTRRVLCTVKSRPS